MKLFSDLLKVTVLLSALSCSAAAVADYSTQTVVEGIRVPWGMVWLPNGDMLVTERGGTLYRVTNGKPQAISGGPKVHTNGQGGLLDIELHPNYSENGWIYISYSDPTGEGRGSNTAIMRAKLEGQNLVEQELLYKATPNTGRGQHYGGRIEFDSEGYLYFSVGDRGNRDENPQDLQRDGGKIYRLKDDGSVPTDNPFVNQAGVKSAIYSYGHRNPQGMTRHPVSGQIWAHEHGPRGGDEVNVIAKGKNYGWPVISYGINYSGTKFTDETARPGMEQPAWYWDPSIAPSGMTFVTSDQYPAWKNQLLVGSLKFAYLVLCQVDGERITSATPIMEGIGRVRNVKQGPDGFVYVAVEGKGIVKIVPNT